MPCTRILSGSPKTTPPLSKTHPKNPYPRRDPHPRTTVSLLGAGGSQERLPAVSSRGQKMKQGRRHPASRHGEDSAPECGHSICQTDCGRWCSDSRYEQKKCVLPCWYHQFLDCWRWVAIIAFAPNSGAFAATSRNLNKGARLAIRLQGKHQ